MASYPQDSKMSFSGWCCQFWTGAYGAARLGGRRVSFDSRRSSCRGRKVHVKPQRILPGVKHRSWGRLWGLMVPKISQGQGGGSMLQVKVLVDVHVTHLSGETEAHVAVRRLPVSVSLFSKLKD